MPEKKIFLWGDIVNDYNLMQYPMKKWVNYQTLPSTVQVKTPGGALYLRGLLRKVLPLAKIEIPTESYDLKVFQTWSQFPKAMGSEEKVKVWRADKIIGRSRAAPDRKSVWKDGIRMAKVSDVLVIDSLGLGWLELALKPEMSGSKRSLLSAFLSSLPQKKKPKIVIKLSSFRDIPLGCMGDFLNRTTFVLSVKGIRERGGAISEAISWDRTIEDTVKEFTTGRSAEDLARCERVVVLFSAEGVAVFENDGKFRLRTFLYHPSEYEGSFKARHPGHSFGDHSILTTSIVRHILDPENYPLFPALSLALSAIREHHAAGLLEVPGETPSFDFEKPKELICEILNLPEQARKEMRSPRSKKTQGAGKRIKEYFDRFGCTFRHDLIGHPDFSEQKDEVSNLLKDGAGAGEEYVAAKAFEIVIRGAEEALKKVPVASYGKFLTADREEIERINALKKMITAYLETSDTKPLSIAVFGPPGSGKSFAIKQLSRELGFDEQSIREFNLSQFQDIQALHGAFHIVRDASVKGKIPIIFWDEFDTNRLEWLKEFLAPMQDGEFRSGSIVHPFGKAIFIFAGGVSHSFEEFEGRLQVEDQAESGASRGETGAKSFKELKLPDFISRLRGFVNIKGPNPPEDKGRFLTEKQGEANHEYLIRRAILLRSILERIAPDLIDNQKTAAVSPAVVQAFLRVGKYKHGARSMEALVGMSNLVSSSYFGESSLPSEDLLSLHVDAEDFRQKLRTATLELPMIELIAEACHTAWMVKKRKEGYRYGPKRSDVKPLRHPLLKPYGQLEENDKEANRITARLTDAKLNNLGLVIEERGPEKKAFKISKNELMGVEHDIWMRDHLMSGYCYGPKTNDLLKIHRCVRCFQDLKDKDKLLDRAIVNSLEKVLKKNGYILSKKEEK